MVIFNPLIGLIECAIVFDTYESSKKLDEFIWNDIPNGYIVIAACMDECTKNLSDSAKLWFENMGSQEIWNLKYRCGFAFIGVVGG